ASTRPPPPHPSLFPSPPLFRSAAVPPRAAALTRPAPALGSGCRFAARLAGGAAAVSAEGQQLLRERPGGDQGVQRLDELPPLVRVDAAEGQRRAVVPLDRSEERRVGREGRGLR